MAKVSVGSSRPRAQKLLSLAILLLSLGIARGQEKDKLEDEQWFKRLDIRQCADLEKTVQKIYTKVSPSVVRILIPGEEKDKPRDIGSGVIVSLSGEVFTCAHFNLPPQTEVLVELADGSRVKGTMLGSIKKPKEGYYRAHDIGMIRLDEKREWPAASLGWPPDLDNGEMCLSIGDPGVHKLGQPPLLRLGRVLPPKRYGTVRSSCRILGGDSGGPLFDLQGRVLGVASGISSPWADNNFASVEAFVKFRDRLRKGEEIVAERRKHTGGPYVPRKYAWGAFEPAQDLAKTMGTAHRSTVEILCDGKPAALGLIVEQDGWIVTKRTELSGCRQIVCRLADSRRLPARIVGGSREHDLALLKVEATELPVGQWVKAGTPRVGQLLASVGPDPRPLHFGVVGGSRVANPGVKGYLLINGKPMTPEGMSDPLFAVTEAIDRPDNGNLHKLLKTGDIITHMDDIPTPHPGRVRQGPSQARSYSGRPHRGTDQTNSSPRKANH